MLVMAIIVMIIVLLVKVVVIKGNLIIKDQEIFLKKQLILLNKISIINNKTKHKPKTNNFIKKIRTVMVLNKMKSNITIKIILKLRINSQKVTLNQTITKKVNLIV